MSNAVTYRELPQSPSISRNMDPAVRTVTKKRFSETFNAHLTPKNLIVAGLIAGATIVVGAPVTIFGGTFVLGALQIPILLGLTATTITAVVLTPLPLLSVLALALYKHRRPIAQLADAPMGNGLITALDTAQESIRKKAGTQNGKNLSLLIERIKKDEYAVTKKDIEDAFRYAKGFAESTKNKRTYADPVLVGKALQYYQENLRHKKQDYLKLDLTEFNRPGCSERTQLIKSLDTFYALAKTAKQDHLESEGKRSDNSTIQNLEDGVELVQSEYRIFPADIRRIKDLIKGNYENLTKKELVKKYNLYKEFEELKKLYIDNFQHNPLSNPKFSKDDTSLAFPQKENRVAFAKVVAQFYALHQALVQKVENNAPADISRGEKAQQKVSKRKKEKAAQKAEKAKKQLKSEAKKRQRAEAKREKAERAERAAIEKASMAESAAIRANMSADKKDAKKAKQAIVTAEKAIKDAQAKGANIELATYTLDTARTQLQDAQVASTDAAQTMMAKPDLLETLKIEINTLENNIATVKEGNPSKEQKIAFNKQARTVYTAAVAFAENNPTYKDALQRIEAVHRKYFKSGAPEKLGRHTSMDTRKKEGVKNNARYVAQLNALKEAAQALTV